MENNQNVATAPTKTANNRSPVSGTTLLWGIAALLIAIVGCTKNNSAMVLSAGLFAKAFAVMVGTVLGLIGAMIGDAVRKFAQPDAVWTSGGIFSLMGIKLFWLLGPQLIGLLIGVFVGIGMVLR